MKLLLAEDILKLFEKMYHSRNVDKIIDKLKKNARIMIHSFFLCVWQVCNCFFIDMKYFVYKNIFIQYITTKFLS